MLAVTLAELFSCVPACVSSGLLAAIWYAEYSRKTKANVKPKTLQQQVEELPVAETEQGGGLEAASEGERADIERQLDDSERGVTSVTKMHAGDNIEFGHEGVCGEGILDSNLEDSKTVVMAMPQTSTSNATPQRSAAKMSLEIKGFASAIAASEMRSKISSRSIGPMGLGERSSRSEVNIDELLRQKQELTGELAMLRNRTPRSARSISRTPRSARSSRSGRSDRSWQSGSSTRSTTSQRIIRELQAQLQKLQEEKRKTSMAAWSAGGENTVPREVIDVLLRQNQEMAEELAKLGNPTPRSSRSDRSGSDACSDAARRIVEELQAQNSRDERDKTRRRIHSADESCPELEGRIEPLMRRLRLPEECDKILSAEGIDFLEDLEDFTEVELVEIGFKRAHAKRLLKAVAVQTAPDASNFPPPVACYVGGHDTRTVDNGMVCVAL